MGKFWICRREDRPVGNIFNFCNGGHSVVSTPEEFIPVEAQNVTTTAEEPEAPETVTAPPLRLSPIASLKRHRVQALIVFCLVLLLGIPVVWIKGRAKYQATAVIYVSPRFQATLE
jgi:hypothetical protein